MPPPLDPAASLSTPSPPHPQPAWLGIRSAVIAALAWPALCELAYTMWCEHDLSRPVPWLAMLAFGAAQALVVLGLARCVDLRAGLRDGGGAGWISMSLLLGLVGQIGATATAAGVTLWVGAGPAEAPVASMWMGILVGPWQWAVAEVAVAARREPSHEAVDAAIRSLGAALAVTHPVVWIVPAVMGVDAPSGPALSMTAASLVPALASLPSALRMAARRRWLASVAEGRVDGWRIDDGAAFPDTAGLVPFASELIVGRPAVLVSTSSSGGPFRADSRGVPIALLPLR
jgi:hypothetical protein